MTRIVIDSALPAKLPELTQPVELCDSAGRVVGRFFPTLDASEFEPVDPNVTDDELQRRKQSTSWYTTAEVLARLGKM